MDAKEPASLEVYADDKKHGVKYLVLTCLTIFIQTLHDVCLDAKIVCLYKHFVLHGSILLSMYWREACTSTTMKRK